MNYEKTIPFEGDFKKSSDILQNTLLPLGFQIVNKYENSIEMEGPKSIAGNSQNALVGISWIHLQKQNNSLILKADFSRIKKTFKFIFISSIIIDMIILPLILNTMIKGNAPIENILLIAVVILSGLFIGLPVMYFMLKNNAAKAVNVIVNNIAATERI